MEFSLCCRRKSNLEPGAEGWGQVLGAQCSVGLELEILVAVDRVRHSTVSLHRVQL